MRRFYFLNLLGLNNTIFFYFRLSSMSNLINTDRNEKPNLLGNLSIGGSAQDLYRWTYKTEIAEMETVL